MVILRPDVHFVNPSPSPDLLEQAGRGAIPHLMNSAGRKQNLTKPVAVELE
jgi:hypothetical protein